MLLKYDLRETARYLGYKRGAEPSEIISELIEEVYHELCEVITPGYIYKKYDFLRTKEGIIVDGIEFKSKKLLNHLRNSESVILFSATLGKSADMLIHKYSVDDIAAAAVAQAVCGSLVENLCDIACEELEKNLKVSIDPVSVRAMEIFIFHIRKNFLSCYQSKNSLKYPLQTVL